MLTKEFDSFIWKYSDDRKRMRMVANLSGEEHGCVDENGWYTEDRDCSGFLDKDWMVELGENKLINILYGVEQC